MESAESDYCEIEKTPSPELLDLMHEVMTTSLRFARSGPFMPFAFVDGPNGKRMVASPSLEPEPVESQLKRLRWAINEAHDVAIYGIGHLNRVTLFSEPERRTIIAVEVGGFDVSFPFALPVDVQPGTVQRPIPGHPFLSPLSREPTGPEVARGAEITSLVVDAAKSGRFIPRLLIGDTPQEPTPVGSLNEMLDHYDRVLLAREPCEYAMGYVRDVPPVGPVAYAEIGSERFSFLFGRALAAPELALAQRRRSPWGRPRA